LAQSDLPNAAFARYEWRFTVRDTGIGIPADRLDAIFEAFTQVDAVTARRYGGTGLGLAICRRLCELMDGTVTARSRPGHGTTVTFTVPAAAAELARRDPVPDDDGRLTGNRVLIVDGNATSRRLLGELLMGSWGMRVVDTSSPAAALRWIGQGQRFDVVLLDEALEEPIRATPGAAAVPVVLLTPFGKAPTVEHARFAAVLTKPLRPAPLIRALTAAVSGPSPAPPTVVQTPTAAALRILVADDHPVNQQAWTTSSPSRSSPPTSPGPWPSPTRCWTRWPSTRCASWSAGIRPSCPAWWRTSWPRPRRWCTRCKPRCRTPTPQSRAGPRTRSRAWARPSGSPTTASIRSRPG
jgi:CheY-like chemotaxis protein